MKIIDIHNHSLPSIDDGAKTVSMAMDMLAISSKANVKEIVLTPHHLNGVFDNRIEKIEKAMLELQTLSNGENLDIRLHLGSEVHLVPEAIEQLIGGTALTFGKRGKAALLELPKNSIPKGTEEMLEKLIVAGITPVIAHPERNSVLRKKIEPLMDWVAVGCKGQLTGASCSGSFGRALQQTSFSMIEKGLVHFIASDAHRPEGRTPDLRSAVETITSRYGLKTCQLLFHDNPQRLLDGEPILNVPRKIISLDYENDKKSKFKWLFAPKK